MFVHVQSICLSGIAKRIAAAGYVVHALDHPGFGLSEGLHGYIPSFDDLADNVIENYRKIKGDVSLLTADILRKSCIVTFDKIFIRIIVSEERY